MSDQPLVLRAHIGLPKCGSTSLQTYFRDSCHPGYLGKGMVGRHDIYKSEQLTNLFREYVSFMPEARVEADTLREMLMVEIRALDPLRSDWIVSDELLSGYGFKPYQYAYRQDPHLLFSRLRRLCDRLILLVVVRRQRDFLWSYYRQLLRHGYCAALDVFLRRQLREPAGLSGLVAYDLYLDQLAAYCDELIVVPFEALTTMESPAREGLLRFGVEVDRLPMTNIGIDAQHALDLLERNCKTLRGIGGSTPAADRAATVELLRQEAGGRQLDLVLHVSHETESAWAELIRASNQRLSARYGWVEGYGYDL